MAKSRNFDDTAKPNPRLYANFSRRTRKIFLPYPLFFVVCRQIDIFRKFHTPALVKKNKKKKGKASKVFCPGQQAIVCSVEKTQLTLKLRPNIGAPWGGSSVDQKIKGRASKVCFLSQKVSDEIRRYFLRKVKNVPENAFCLPLP